MPQQQLSENRFGHGARPIGRIRRTYRKLRQPILGRAGIPFDWNTGFDVESTLTLMRKSQGQSYSCSGQAASSFLEAQRKLAGVNEVLSAKSMYSPIAYKGGGTTVDSLETQVGSRGANLEQDVSSYQNGLVPSETFMEDTSWETTSLKNDAIKRAGYTPFRVAPDIDSIAEAIRDRGGVIVELVGQNNGTWLSQFPVPPSKATASPLWYHFLYFKGAKMVNGKKYLIALNSWGAEVGLNGTQFFGEDYVVPKFFLEVSSFIKDTLIQPTPDNTSVWVQIWQWFHDNVFLVTPKMA